jgi:hypothetical protein
MIWVLSTFCKLWEGAKHKQSKPARTVTYAWSAIRGCVDRVTVGLGFMFHPSQDSQREGDETSPDDLDADVG